MDVELTYWLIGLSITLAILLSLVIWLLVVDRTRQARVILLEKNLETLKQTVNALCSSAVGVDRRVNRLERHGRDLQERQDNYESQQQSDPPYADAIKLVKEGAGAEHLVRKLGLSRGAADLIIMIHGTNTANETED